MESWMERGKIRALVCSKALREGIGMHVLLGMG